MRHIDISELPEHTDGDLSSSRTIAVERNGRVIGYLMPVKEKDVERIKRDLEALDRTIDAALRNGYTREQLAEDLDLSKPLRDDS
jgi:hypothetical protein